MSAAHTPGQTCNACEGFCLQPAERRIDAGVEISLRIGQRVRHRDFDGKRVTGVVRGISVDSDRVLQADIALDAPIVIPARSADDREVRIWHQHVPAHELAPFDDRDEAIAGLLAALKRCTFDSLNMSPADMEFILAAITKAAGVIAQEQRTAP